MVVSVVVCFAVLFLIDLPKFKKGVSKKEAVIYAVLFLGAFVLAVLVSLDVEVPSPINMLRVFFERNNLGYPVG